jgi:chitinase
MALLKLSVFVFVATALYLVEDVRAFGKISCFYNSKAAERKDLAKVTPEDLKPALSVCNYLVYGFIGIDDEDYEAESLDKSLDTEKGKNLFKTVTDLKKQYPALKVLVSVGGFTDSKTPEKYLKVLEKTDRRAKFVTSVTKLAKDYDFDGVDLAWQFPVVKENKTRSTLGSIWHSIKKAVTISTKDDHEKEHKEEFTALVRELGAALRGYNKILTLSMLPHTNKKAYIDATNIKDSVEHIHLMTYDFRTPDRTEDQADYAAPTQLVGSRVPEQNLESVVNWWVTEKFPANKLLIAVPTHGKTWKMTTDSGKTGVPPVKVDGPGEAGPYLKEEGTMAYYEICPILVSASSPNTASTLLKKVPDPTNRLGAYAYRLPASKVKGIWISYEDPEVAGKKAYYAKLKGLGGVAIVDLSLDDFKGSCDATRTKFPILHAVKLNL